MSAQTYMDLAAKAAEQITELFPWDLEKQMRAMCDCLLIDVRERKEFDAAHIKGSVNVPRGILEPACDYDYPETVPELVAARERPVVLICRSGHRSALAAFTMQLMGYEELYSLKLGVKGWNDTDLPLVDGRDLQVSPDDAQHVLEPMLAPEQLRPRV